MPILLAELLRHLPDSNWSKQFCRLPPKPLGQGAILYPRRDLNSHATIISQRILSPSCTTSFITGALNNQGKSKKSMKISLRRIWTSIPITGRLILSQLRIPVSPRWNSFNSHLIYISNKLKNEQKKREKFFNCSRFKVYWFTLHLRIIFQFNLLGSNL